MKNKRILLSALALTALAGCGRNIRTAEDVTPGNPKEKELSWKYGANDIRIQTGKITKVLMDRWYHKTQYNLRQGVKPRIIITQVDNRTDTYISTDMIREIIESVAIEDGRLTIVVGDTKDERELDALMSKVLKDPKYSNSSILTENHALAPQFLAKIRITKALTEQKRYDLEDYRMSITLYDIETQEALDSAWDSLRKKVEVF